MNRYWHLGLLSVTVILGACSRTDSDMRVWRANDHEQDQSAGPPAVGPLTDLPSNSPAPTTAAPQDAQAVWSSLCAGCHGQIGQGDGPMGLSVAARNLADPRWQSSITDEQIAAVITHGKGRMPTFSLKADTVKSLIRLIRDRGTK